MKDTTVILPTLTVILEGFGTINTWSILVNGIMQSSNTNPIPVNVVLSSEVKINVKIMNSGANIAPDYLYGQFSSANVTPKEASLLWSATEVPVGGSISPSWSFPMPANNVVITINAGHLTTEVFPLKITGINDIADIIGFSSEDGFEINGIVTFVEFAVDGYATNYTVVTPEAIKINIYPGITCINNAQISIWALNLGRYITIYFPATTGSKTYYVALNGSTYLDVGLTQLAKAAP